MKNSSLIIVAAVLVGFVLVFRGQLGSLLSPGGSYLTGVGQIPQGASTQLLPMPVPPGGAGSPLSPLGAAISGFTSSLASAFGRTSATGQASAGPPATPVNLDPNAPFNQGLNLWNTPSNDTPILPLTGPVSDSNLLDFSSIDLGMVSPGLADPALTLDPSLDPSASISA